LREENQTKYLIDLPDSTDLKEGLEINMAVDLINNSSINLSTSDYLAKGGKNLSQDVSTLLTQRESIISSRRRL
jgi:hypothetical protein